MKISPHAEHVGRDEGIRDLPRLALAVPSSWREIEPRRESEYSDYSRAVYWVARDYFEARGEPASPIRRHKRAIWVARVALIDTAFHGHTDREVAKAIGVSVRSVERRRADKRSAVESRAQSIGTARADLCAALIRFGDAAARPPRISSGSD